MHAARIEQDEFGSPQLGVPRAGDGRAAIVSDGRSDGPALQGELQYPVADARQKSAGESAAEPPVSADTRPRNHIVHGERLVQIAVQLGRKSAVGDAHDEIGIHESPLDGVHQAEVGIALPEPVADGGDFSGGQPVLVLALVHQ